MHSFVPKTSWQDCWIHIPNIAESLIFNRKKFQSQNFVPQCSCPLFLSCNHFQHTLLLISASPVPYCWNSFHAVKKSSFLYTEVLTSVKNIYILLQAIRKPACNHKIFQYNENKFKEKGKKRKKKANISLENAVPKMVFYFFICLSSLLPN